MRTIQYIFLYTTKSLLLILQNFTKEEKRKNAIYQPVCLFAILSILDISALECLYLTLFSDLRIFRHFGALRGASGVTDGRCTTSGGWQGRSNQKDLAFYSFKGAVPLFTHEKNLLILAVFLVTLWPWGGPRGDAWVKCHLRRVTG